MKARIAVLSVALLLAATVGIGAKMTIIWSNEEAEGSVPLTQENHDSAWAACPGDPEPESGNALTSCQEEWWNGGDPHPIGGGG
jgi:hypothetical protein